jgi:DNA polymerase V
MEENIFYPSDYKGSKGFSQWDVHTANATGFGAAADDYAERGIDLNEQLIRNKPATFFMRVNSDAMIGTGIHPGDVVIVDRSIEAKSGKVVIAVVDGEMLIRRLEISQGKKRLIPATKKLSAIDISESAAFSIWGVVTFVIHSV